MWELDYKESWVLKNWCFWTVLLEKTLESPWDCKEIQPINPKGNQSWIFTGRTDAEAETPMFWPPDVKNWLTGKELDAEKVWRLEKKGATEDEMVEWHHWLDGHEFEQAPRDNAGERGLAYCSPQGCKVRHDWVTEQQQRKLISVAMRMKCYFDWPSLATCPPLGPKGLSRLQLHINHYAVADDRQKETR